MNFEYGADPYFVREQAFERVGNADAAVRAVTPSLSPLFSPSGLIYRYVLQSPDRSPQELKIIEDWVLERRYRAIQGVADDSGFGGTTMQYQVLLDPNKLFAYGVTVPQVVQQLGNNNANAGGGFYSQGGQFYYIRGLGLVRDTADIGNIVLQQKGGIPVYVKDVAKVADRPRAAARPVRLHEAGRGRGRRHPDARRRAGAGDPEARRGDDQGAERARAAAGREDRPVLRPPGPDRRDHQDRGSATCCAACCWCW